MTTLDHRSAESWASLFGFVTVPLFGRQRGADAAGEHFVLLDGQRSSLTFSRGDARSLLESRQPAAWAWSANVPKSVIVDDETAAAYAFRWDHPQDVRELRDGSVQSVQNLLAGLETPTDSEIETSVKRALAVFRSVRQDVWEFGGNDEDATRAFMVLLVLADSVRRGEFPATERYLADAVAALAERGHRLIASTFSAQVGAYPIGDLAMELLGDDAVRRLDPYLLIRHASGTLFQEAHIALRDPPAVEPRLLVAIRAGMERPAGARRPDVHYTPTPLARFLTELAVGEYRRLNPGATKIEALDPACGSGVFLVESLRELEGSKLSLAVRGVDSSPVSKLMADFALLSAKADFEAAGGSASVQIDVGDSLDRAWGEPDIILMNPPFLPWRSVDGGLRDKVRQSLGSLYKGHADTAIAFVAKAVREMKDGGVLAAVVPAAFLGSLAAAGVRTFLSGAGWRVAAIGRVRDYGYFANATVEPAFFVVSKSPRDSIPVRTLLANSDVTDLAIRAARITPTDVARVGSGWELGVRDTLDATDWTPRPSRSAELLLRLSDREVTRVAGSLFKIHLGIRTGANPVFIVPPSLLEEAGESERGLFRPIADTIKRGRVQEAEFIFYPYRDGRLTIGTEAELEAAAPVFYAARLLPNRSALVGRSSIRHRHWWELSEPRTQWLRFGSPRIVSVTFGRRGSFGFDSEGKYAVHQGNAWLWKGKGSLTPKVWLAYLALLNSSLFEAMLDHFCPRTRGGQYELAHRFLKNVPLPDLARQEVEHTERLVEFGLAIHEGREYNIKLLDETVIATYGISAGEFIDEFNRWPRAQLGPATGVNARASSENDAAAAAEFATLADEWRRGRSPSSSMERLAAHPAYRKIVGMGVRAVPYLLRELEQRPAQWFWALREITKQDPVSNEDRGNLKRSVTAWLKWGKENGYRW